MKVFQHLYLKVDEKYKNTSIVIVNKVLSCGTLLDLLPHFQISPTHFVPHFQYHSKIISPHVDAGKQVLLVC